MKQVTYIHTHTCANTLLIHPNMRNCILFIQYNIFKCGRNYTNQTKWKAPSHSQTASESASASSAPNIWRSQLGSGFPLEPANKDKKPIRDSRCESLSSQPWSSIKTEVGKQFVRATMHSSNNMHRDIWNFVVNSFSSFLFKDKWLVKTNVYVTDLMGTLEGFWWSFSCCKSQLLTLNGSGQTHATMFVQTLPNNCLEQTDFNM